MQITVRYQSIDGVDTRKTYGTLAGVRRYVEKVIGKCAEFNSSGMYAVSNDGIGKVTLIEVMGNDTGRRLNSLQAVMVEPKPEPGPFEVWTYIVNEDAGTSTPSKAGDFATLAAAMEQVEELERYADGAQIKATTPEAQAELDVLRFDANKQPSIEEFF